MNDDETRRTRLRILLSAAIVAAGLSIGLVGCDKSANQANAQEPAPEEKRDDEKAGGAVAPSEEDDRYSTLVEPKEIPTNEPTTVTLAIAAGDGLKVNEEYPSWSVKVGAVDGIELEKRSFSREDFKLTKTKAMTEATVRGKTSGTATVSGTANFSVCNDETCHIMRDEPVQFRIEVAESGGNDSKERTE